LTDTERPCSDCGQLRQEIGVDTTGQYDFKPAEVFTSHRQESLRRVASVSRRKSHAGNN
jgi:transposase